ncbi:MAG: PEP-CTERM sorting domain-containing protein [Anaerolineae bacterium]
MKKPWLRGVLLGVSLALLLAGGVALAASLSITSDQTCFECLPDEAQEEGMGIWFVVMSGYDLNYPLCHSTKGPGFDYTDCHTATTDTETWAAGILCDGGGQASLAGSEVSLWSDATGQEIYGTYTWRVWQVETGESDEVGATLEDVCPEAVEEVFVPEPGSILLLGSGLAGLAGYAALRWRTRE